ncbi:MAG: alpha/beta hydrolase [Angustibacter sp.]
MSGDPGGRSGGAAAGPAQIPDRLQIPGPVQIPGRRIRALMPWRTQLLCFVADRMRGRPLSELSVEEIRRERRRRTVPHTPPWDTVFGRVPRGVRIDLDSAPTRAGSVLVRWYHPTGARPDVPGPLLVYLHGGGWVYGDVRDYDAVCGQVAARIGAPVLSVGYRLAPEHRFPAAVEDCLDVVTWVRRTAANHGVDPDRIAVMGDSAGGNLAAVVAQQARDAGEPVSAQVLVYPAIDATFSSPSVDRLADAPILTRRGMHDFLDRYHPVGDPTDPRLSPLHAPDLAGLPPALVQTAALDPLVDDGARYARALQDAGVPVRYTEYVGAPHGFISFPGAAPAAAQAIAEAAAFLRLVWS